MGLHEGLSLDLPLQCEVINSHKDMVYRLAFMYCKNRPDAEDITQEVFVRYLRNAHVIGFNSAEHLKAWLITVTANVSKSLLRSAWRRKTVPLQEMEPAGTPQPFRDGVYKAVMSLAEKYRVAILLYYFEGYSVKEIAKALNRTETAVQTQLQRARAMLKEKLKEEWQDE